ncbi:MAG: hypothetical protein AB7H88_06460 [Vicinamibacterales bacterium]
MHRERTSALDLGLLAAPLPAVLIGAAVMSRVDVPPALWGADLAAAGAGMGVAWAAGRWHPRAVSRRRATPWLLAGALALLAATLAFPGIDGVRRWVPAGPLALHAGAIVIPPLFVMLSRTGAVVSAAAALAVMGILLLQPDAAQAWAFAAGWTVLAVATRGRAAAIPAAAVVLVAAVTLLRADPLAPVPHVEGSVGLAVAQGRVWGGASVLALVAPPIVLALTPDRAAGTTLAAYFACTLVAAALGSFPVPFLGYGVSPILGYYLGIAGLAPDLARVSAAAPLPVPTPPGRAPGVASP